MKRSPLNRRGWLRSRRVKPATVIAADIWRDGLGGCAVCRHEHAACDGRIDGHHIIPKRALIRLGFSDYLLDKRNRIGVCRHRHEQHENGYKPIPRELLPAAVFEFADEISLGWYLDRHYPAAQAAAKEVA